MFVNSRDGSEYYLLKWLLKQKKQTQDRIPICFVTMDLQVPPEQWGLHADSFDKLILNFVQQSDYLVLHGSAGKTGRVTQRIFLLNAHEPFCVEKYLGQWCKPAGE